MKSGPDATAVYDDPDRLPSNASRLFGSLLYDSLAWYRVVLATSLPAGAVPCFLVTGNDRKVVFPMCLASGKAMSLTTPYTCLWQPLGAADADWRAAGRALAAWCRGRGPVRLEALDLADVRWDEILAGVREAGLIALTFDHFGNWFGDVGGDFEAYLAARPGALRATFQRRWAKLEASGAALRMATGGDGLEPAIAAYEAVYARSWKPAEPHPAFNPALMRACAADGSLRLALLERDGQPLAAQFWSVCRGTATVHKLAYDAAEKASSPGTVLMGLAIRHLMDTDRVTRLDFGRGDDSYKRDWTGQRRQRSGLLLVDPWRPAGMAAILQHGLGRARASVLAR